ncbi:FAD dependent oxidoreductase domain-containing protein [Ditylenchus destructor]|nr:FAD dependent oxidoreductase domain-containing protein [Ditylenchus destructor]
MIPKVAVIGQGVIGLSSALAIKQTIPGASLTLFADRKFEDTCSYGPAGLFRLDFMKNKEWARASFERYAEIERNHSPEETGVKLISGHIQSDDKELLDNQDRCMSDIVYNFHWLTERELKSMFPNPSKYAIHYTAYASEGRRYVPWLRKQLENIGNVEFHEQKFSSLKELVDGENFDAIINCAGLYGGKLAGDDDSVYPVRGVALEVEAPWHKHFNYKDVLTFTIPMVDTVILGTQKQEHRSDMEITDEDRKDIWQRYMKLHPTFKNAKIISEWCGLRAARPSVRLEHCKNISPSGRSCHVIHNYGHGSNGFTLGWGCALDVANILSPLI